MNGMFRAIIFWVLFILGSSVGLVWAFRCYEDGLVGTPIFILALLATCVGIVMMIRQGTE